MKVRIWFKGGYHSDADLNGIVFATSQDDFRMLIQQNPGRTILNKEHVQMIETQRKKDDDDD